ncbi:MAG: transposase [Rhodobacteraceae bacterium]|nr:transposase [Paracoccaceae bacterium]
MAGTKRNSITYKCRVCTDKPRFGLKTGRGIRDHKTNPVAMSAAQSTKGDMLKGFIQGIVEEGFGLYTNEHKPYEGIEGYQNDSVNHSTGEYAWDGMIPTNGIESFLMFKRTRKGVHQKMSPKHLRRHLDEFSGRHNIREGDTVQQLNLMVHLMKGKCLTCWMLKVDNGFDSGVLS